MSQRIPAQCAKKIDPWGPKFTISNFLRKSSRSELLSIPLKENTEIFLQEGFLIGIFHIWVFCAHDIKPFKGGVWHIGTSSPSQPLLWPIIWPKMTKMGCDLTVHVYIGPKMIWSNEIHVKTHLWPWLAAFSCIERTKYRKKWAKWPKMRKK